jgi:serine/threonine protein kinase/Tfp pilus assembly protein PilF
VALKLPRREVGSADHFTQLQHEARAAAALNHPNIVHLYSVEEAEGQIFITMELVEGRSLRELLREQAPLALPRTLAFASQIAEGLACAHAAGVLHRDLKPANVMVTNDDRVKILDFGVATFFTSVGTLDADAVTTMAKMRGGGEVMGTVGYMSPEQALGKALDARTDLFALGVILFEMTTGRAPFAGETLALTFDQLLNRRPQSPLVLNPALPPNLSAVIEKALEKDPDHRYRSAGEFLEALKGVDPQNTRSASVSVAPESRMPASIVVLPFLDLSPGQDQEYFCHGITDEIIATLTKVPGLGVISRTSAFAFQGKGLEVTEIGRRLRVEMALEGTVRRAGNQVRISAQLVNAESGYQVWSRRFDRELSDVFAIQDEIAATIAHEFQGELAPHQQEKRAAFDLSAYDAYLRGMYAMHKWTDDAVQRAIVDFNEAIARDESFAPAYAALGEAYVWRYSGLGILASSESVPQARSAVDKALELAPTLADAHRVRGLIAMNHDWDRRAAEESLARALQLAPGSAAAHFWNAWRLALLERRHDQAIVELEEAERLDPLDLQVKTQIGYIHYFHHDFDRAVKQFERVVALEPSFAFAHYALGDVCTQKGQYDRAFAEFNRAVELGGRSVNHIGVLGYAYGRSGNRERAEAHLHELAVRAQYGYVSAMWTAMIYLGLGEFEKLFEWLGRAFEERDGSLILITAAVEFDPVRDHPRFEALLRKMGLGHLAASA